MSEISLLSKFWKDQSTLLSADSNNSEDSASTPGLSEFSAKPFRFVNYSWICFSSTLVLFSMARPTFAK